MREASGVGILDSAVLACAAVIAVGVVLVARQAGSAARGGSRRDLLGYAGLAALSASVSGLAFTVAPRTGAATSLAIANGTMVFAAAMVWAAARRVNGRPAIDLVPTVAVSAAVAGLTFFTPGQSAGLKVLCMAAICAAAFLETRRVPLRTLPGSRILAVTCALYGVYSAARLAGAAVLGIDSPAWRALFSMSAVGVVSVAAILALCSAVFRMAQSLDDAPVAATPARRRAALRFEGFRMLREQGPLAAWTISSADDELIRAAHGSGRADEVTAAIAAAARRALPGSVTGRLSGRSVVVMLAAHAVPPGAEGRIRRAFAELSPRIGHGALPDLEFAQSTLHSGAELSRLLTRHPEATTGPAGQPALPPG